MCSTQVIVVIACLEFMGNLENYRNLIQLMGKPYSFNKKSRKTLEEVMSRKVMIQDWTIAITY